MLLLIKISGMAKGSDCSRLVEREMKTDPMFVRFAGERANMPLSFNDWLNRYWPRTVPKICTNVVQETELGPLDCRQRHSLQPCFSCRTLKIYEQMYDAAFLAGRESE